MTKPFRFGVQIAQCESASAWRDKARKLEDLGYSTLFMPDHFGEELAPLPAIAMAAAHTTTLKVGALVFDNDHKIGWIRDAAGARLDDIEIQMRFFICKVTDDRMKLAKAMAPGFGVSPEEALESGAALVGSESEIIEQLHRRRERWGLSYVI